MATEQQKLKCLLQELLNCKATKFPKARKPLEAPTHRGVYLIISPKGFVLHVGRTPKAANGIKQRLYNHLHSSSSSFVKVYLHGKGAKLRNGYDEMHEDCQNSPPIPNWCVITYRITATYGSLILSEM